MLKVDVRVTFPWPPESMCSPPLMWGCPFYKQKTVKNKGKSVSSQVFYSQQALPKIEPIRNNRLHFRKHPV